MSNDDARTPQEPDAPDVPVAAAPAANGVPTANTAPPAAPVVLPDGADLSPQVIQTLRQRLQTAVEQHDGWADPLAFNGGTILVLLLTGLATLLPTMLEAGRFAWAAPLCSALAGLFVAMERALGFGARWRYHREMKSAYESIIDMLEFYPILPLSERPKYARDIYTSLYAVRSRESAIPNAGTNTQPT
ncbi:hypothetical protein BH11PSE9_BH11PSE9_14440 [soil metagenome]